MNIPHYTAKLFGGMDVIIDVDDDDVDRLIVVPPDPDDPDAGHEEGVRTEETIEYHRALTAWLIVHQRQHPQFHKEYRKKDPGGRRKRPDTRKQRDTRDQEETS